MSKIITRETGTRTKIPFVVAAALVVILALVPFWPALDGEFVFDDSEAIVNNCDVTDCPWTGVFRNDFWGRSILSNSSHKSYRPLTVLTFRLSYYLSDGLHPWGFHVFNLVLHAVVSVLLLVVYQSVVSDGRQATVCAPYTVSAVPLFSAALFAAHPVHAENVAGIVGRADVLCAAFYFVAFLLYARLCSSLNDDSGSVDRPCSVYYLTTFLLCCFLSFMSMLCKEHGITVLGVCGFYDTVVTLRKYASSKKQESEYRALVGLAIRVSVIGLVGLSFLLFRFWIMNGTVPVFQDVDNPASFAKSWWQRTANYNYIYTINLWILLYPMWLCFDWSMGCIPLIHNVDDFRLLAVALLWFVLLYALLTCARNWRTIKMEFLVAMMLTVIPFLPATNLFLKVGFVVAERILYVSSAGFCLLVGLGLQRLRDRCRPSLLVSAAAVACVVLLSLRSLHRSLDWRTEELLFRSGLSVCPLNAKVHYNIAKNAADSGQPEVAIERYGDALLLHPDYDQAMNNLANILKDRGHLRQAETLLKRSVAIRPNFAAAWMNLGIVHVNLMQFSEAESSYLTALTHRNRYPDCYYNLGNLYLDLKRYDDAYRAWKNATRLRPTHAVAWNNMIIMLDNTGDLQRARTVAEEAIRWLPDEASLHFNLANVLGKLALFEESEKHFLIAIELNSANAAFYSNLGVLYHRAKRFRSAEEAYRQALRINPESSTARDNLKLLLLQQEKT